MPQIISLFAWFKYTVKIYAHNFMHLLKISINNPSITIYTHKYTYNNPTIIYNNTYNNYYKKYT